MKNLFATIGLLFTIAAASAQIDWHNEDNYTAIMDAACQENKRVLIQFGEQLNGLGEISTADRNKIDLYFYCVYLPVTSEMGKQLQVKREAIYLLEKDGWTMWAGPIHAEKLRKEVGKYFNRSKAGCLNPQNEARPEKEPDREVIARAKKLLESKIEKPKPEPKREVTKKPELQEKGIAADTEFQWNEKQPAADLTPKCDPEVKFHEPDYLAPYSKTENAAPVKSWTVQLGVYSTKLDALKGEAKLIYNSLVTEPLFLEYQYNDVLKGNYWHVMTGRFQTEYAAEIYADSMLHELCKCDKDDAIVKKLLNPSAVADINETAW